MFEILTFHPLRRSQRIHNIKAQGARPVHRDNNSIRSAHPPRSSLSHDVSSVGESRHDTIKGQGEIETTLFVLRDPSTAQATDPCEAGTRQCLGSAG